MKFLATILSLYILALTIYPCIDKPGDNVLCKTSITKASSDNHNNSDDNCTPFCTCTHSAPLMINHYHYFDFKPVIMVQKCIVAYTASYISSHYNSFWQPPKLG
ncbi:MAG: hypothetical protein Q8909_00785 [Bacteroidota bacterium]|nr:hypothetical protein [Bacteroidota bacterium]